MRGDRTKEECGPVFKAIPRPPASAKSRLLILSEYAVNTEEALDSEQRSLILDAMKGVKFDYTYVTPVVKCPHVRTPTKKMMEHCQDLLEKEIEIVKPTVIITLGKGPATLFDVSGKITDIKMMIFDVEGLPGQKSWGYGPKLVITENIDKVLKDVGLRSDFFSAFRKAERFKEPGAEIDAGIISYGMFESPDEFGKWVDTFLTMEQKPILSCDIETVGLNPFALDARMRTISMSWREGVGRCVPFELDPDGYRPHLKRLLEDRRVWTIWFNAK